MAKGKKYVDAAARFHRDKLHTDAIFVFTPGHPLNDYGFALRTKLQRQSYLGANTDFVGAFEEGTASAEELKSVSYQGTKRTLKASGFWQKVKELEAKMYFEQVRLGPIREN